MFLGGSEASLVVAVSATDRFVMCTRAFMLVLEIYPRLRHSLSNRHRLVLGVADFGS